MTAELNNKIWFHPKFAPLWEPWDFNSFYGGRGGLKSWSVASFLVTEAASHFERILCAREIQNSISDSVHRLLVDQIKRLNLEGHYNITDTYLSCPATGSEFLFAGLRTNVSKIKSMEGITKCWVEEAAKVTKDSWEKLIPTIFRVKGSKIIVTFNPEDESDPTSQMFIASPMPNSKNVPIGWEDNPFLDPKMISIKDHAYRVDPDGAAHVWGGEFKKNSKAQVFAGKYRIESFEVPYEIERSRSGVELNRRALWNGPYFGGDFGFAQDPSTLLKMWIDQPNEDFKRLMIEWEAYGVGVPLSQMGKFYDQVPDARNHTVRCDNARPETIFHLRELGFDAIAATKWAGSVEDGIEFLKGFDEIVIHPRCVNTGVEFRMYSFKTDRITGDVLREIVDRWNHCIDPIRYALDPAICVPEETLEIEHESYEEAISSDLDMAL